MRILVRVCNVYIALLALAIGLSSQLFASTVTELLLHSQPNEPLGLGLDYDFRTSDGSFITSLPPPCGSMSCPFMVSFQFLGNQIGTFADVAFVAPLNDVLLLHVDEVSPLITGTTYSDAGRFPFEPANHPGLNVDLDGRGLDKITGTFTVLEAVYSIDGNIQHFGATFVQTPTPSIGNDSLSGVFYYNFDQSLATPEPSSVSLVGGVVLVMVCLRAGRICRTKRTSLHCA